MLPIDRECPQTDNHRLALRGDKQDEPDVWCGSLFVLAEGAAATDWRFWSQLGQAAAMATKLGG